MGTGYRDQTRACAECGREFVWRSEQQRQARQEGDEQPPLCGSCRRAKRARERERQEGGVR